MEVARRDLEEGSAEPPRALRRYLGFAKLSAPTLRAIAKAVEDAPTFRARVGEEAEEAVVGRAGWLWLTRPEGWRAELDEIQLTANEAAAARADEQAEHGARRKLALARQKVEEAEADARRHRQQAQRWRDDLAAERARRMTAEAEANRLSGVLTEREDERNRAVRELKDLEARYSERAVELRRLKEQVAGQADMSRAEASPMGSRSARPELVELADAVQQVRGQLDAATRSLLEVAERLSDGDDHPRSAEPARHGMTADEPTADEPTADAPTADEPVGKDLAAHEVFGRADTRRTPAKLPGGVLDDSPEAAAHLLSLGDVTALVDGYNVSMAGWPDLPVVEQRARLVQRLDGLAARTGAVFHVVFDGADVPDLRGGAPLGARGVHVRFSPPDREADDVLLDAVGELPGTSPVVVVSSDNRVRRGVRRQGANVLYSHQLLALFR